MQEQDSLRDELLSQVASIAPILAEHASESEKFGRLDASSMEAVHGTRLLSMYCPCDLGGLEADPVTATLILDALARIDGSAGWTIGILASSGLGAYLPLTAARRFFAKGVQPVAASLSPKGQAELVVGGALFDTNPLQRCFRDVYAAGQHFLVSQSSYRALGQFKLRHPDANPML